MSELLNSSPEDIPKKGKSTINIPQWEGTEINERIMGKKAKENNENNKYIKKKTIQKKENLLEEILIDQLNETQISYLDKSFKKEKNNGLYNFVINNSDSLISKASSLLSINEKSYCPNKGYKEFNQAELRIEQDELIEKILGSNKGFNNKYIKGFNKEKGNYLIKINDFENKYKTTENIQELNSLELGNYIKYLSNKNTKESKRIINDIRIKLGPNTTIFDKQDESIISFIEETFNEIEETFNNFIKKMFDFSNFNDFIKLFIGESKTEKKAIIEHLKENNDNYRNIFLLSIEKSLPDKYNDEEKKEIANNLLENLRESTAEDAVIKLEAFKKEFNSNLDTQKTSQKVSMIQENENKIKIAEALQNGDNKLAEQLSEKAKITQLGFKKVNLLSTTQFTELSTRLQNGESFNEIVQEISQENEELKELLEKEKSNSRVENDKKHDNDEEHNNYNIDEDDYIPTNGGYSVQLKHGENFPGLIITPEEKKLTMGNPEALKNLVDFYEILSQTGLNELWSIRHKIINAIGSNDVNLDGDYLNENEVKIFLSKVLISIGITPPKKDFSIEQFKNIIIKLNGVQLGGNLKKVNLIGETKLTKSFKDKFGDRNGTFIEFKSGEFKKSITK